MSFPESAPSANPVFFRTYSRKTQNGRESWDEVCDRTIQGLIKLGHFTPAEAELVDSQQRSLKCLTSGRWLWVGGTPWIEEHDNFPGSYNCSSTNVVDWDSFGLLMNLAMMGCGTGAVLEPQYINQLPKIVNRLEVTIVEGIGTNPERNPESTIQQLESSGLLITVGDSREGWVLAYQTLLEIASDPLFGGKVRIDLDLGNVRPAGEKLKGFGGTSNPIKLPELFGKCAKILNGAVGRNLTALECCKLIDEAALVVVAGSIRRSAGIRQFSPDDEEATLAKFGLWIQDDEGNWKIDPERDALRMANHTRVFHSKPDLDTIIDSVQKQFYSGEGAIQYAPEAIARASADLLNTPELKSEFLKIYTQSGRFAAQTWLTQKFFISMDDADDRLKRYGLNPCVVGETKVLTRNGYLRIDELCHREVEVWNGFEWSTVAPEITGYNQEIMRVELSNGSVLRCTPYHKFHLAVGKTGKTKIVEAKDLAIGDKLIKHELPVIEKGENYPSKQMYTQGFHQADGLTGVPFVRLYGVKMELADKMLLELKEKHNNKYRDAKITCPLEGKDWVPFEASLNERLEWLAGLIDGDGSAMQDGSVHISSINKDFLFNTLLMLQTCGINSKVRPEHKECDKLMPDGRGGSKVYHCQASWRLCISSVEVQKLLSMGLKCYRVKLDGFNPNRNASRHITVESLSMESELADVYCFTESKRHLGMFGGVLTGQCGEIIMSNNTCNLAEVHLNQIDPKDLHAQKQAFQAGALSVAALLNHRFTVDRYQQSREADPIVGVSFTGLFDFFVHAFGPEWLQWWAEGRTDNWNIQSSDEGTHYHLSDYFRDSEVYYLMRWRRIVEQTVWKYCDRHGLKRPNRCTTVQPGGTKSLLTGASAGWHPPKAARFLRRITFSKNHPVALACLDYGYPIVPSQSDTDLDGNLLNDPFDDRCTEWLVEIPTETSWANLPGADQIDISRFSATAQFDFYMQVQRYYVGHNTSATLELREDEIEPLAEAIHAAIENNAGYISSALLARFDNLETFPRLPFEPISKEEYDRLHAEVLARRKSDDFDSLLAKYDRGDEGASGPAGCDSDKCLFPVQGKG